MAEAEQLWDQGSQVATKTSRLQESTAPALPACRLMLNLAEVLPALQVGSRRRVQEKAGGSGASRGRGRTRRVSLRGSKGRRKGPKLSPLSHASKKSFSFRVFSSFTSRTSFSAITSLGDEEDGEEGREEEETPERSVLGYRAAIIAAHDGGRPGDGGGAPMGADPDPSPAPELENG